MSFYRIVLAAVAAMGFATAVFAEDATTATSAADTTKPAVEAPAATADQAANTSSTDATQEKVNVNKANAKDLAKVKGVTTTKAKAIVAYRKKHGEFKSLEALKEVKGFKKMDEKTMKDIQDQLTVG